MPTLADYQATVDKIFAEEQFVGTPHGLYDPIEYTLRLGGKRIRPILLLSANALFGGNVAEVRNAALGIEIFHNFTLLHDDLMDRSPLRRGHPTVYARWDDNTAVLSGDTMFALAWRYFLRQDTLQLQHILQCFNETAIEVCEGQQKDMDFERLGLGGVSLEAYQDMIRQKTAVLLSGALKIGALYANAPDAEIEKLYQFGLHLGMAFQMQDDLLDGYGDTAVFGKKTGQDIRDNKISYLPLTALTMVDNDSRAQLLSLYSAKGNMDEEEKVTRVMNIYNNIGLKTSVEQSIRNEYNTANRWLDDIDAPEDLKQPLREIGEALADRKK